VKAVVIERPNEISFCEVELPALGPDDVLVRSHKAGVCRTDLEVLHGELDPRWVRYPCVPGHEWSGSVAEVGANVTEVASGDRVVCEGIIPCHRCRRCRGGETYLCENYDQLGFTRGGGYGEYVVAPRHVVHRLPDNVSFDAAVLVEPASVVVHGLERAALRPGDRIGVVGVGTLGALAIAIARLHSPREIVAYGIRDEELELARRVGADRVVNTTAGSPAEGELEVVVETAGAVQAAELATRLTREGGRIVLLGIAGHGRVLELPADRLPLRSLSLLGSVAYSTAAWTRVLELLAAELVDFEAIVTHRFPAKRFEDAFRLLENRDGVVGKVLLEHVAG
jgi:2-desacetyl-2-hydroxyethyl bacteriochlorophyllide A dehydrogenase